MESEHEKTSTELTARANIKMQKSEKSIDSDSMDNSGDYKSISDGHINIDNYYSRLITEAPYIKGDSKPLIPISEIPWADPQLIKTGVNFGLRNIFSMIIANTAALMYGFALKPESLVLLRSGRFFKPESSFRRYLSTARRIGSWYIYNILNENSEAYKNIKMVRKLHTHFVALKRRFPTPEEIDCTPEKIALAKVVRDDLSYLEIPDAPSHLLTWDPPLQFSQFDMAMTQFGFIGLVYLYPEALGINDMRNVEAFLHYWAVIGRLLGLEDRFNLALHPDKKLFAKIYENIGLASLKSTDETVICLQHALVEGFSRRVPFLTLKGLLFYGLKEENEGFKGEGLWKVMNYKDKTSYYVVKSVLTIVYKLTFVRYIANFFTVIVLHLAYWIYLPSSTQSCPF